MSMDIRRLRDLAALSAGANPKLLAASGAPQEFPFIAIRDVNQSLTEVSGLSRIAASPAAVERFQLKVNDVVITTRGADIRAAVAGSPHAGTVIGANIAIVRIHA